MFTRYGEVAPLLPGADDRFVIFGPGDELVLRFDARCLPPIPTGRARDFLFCANGWVQDGDSNTASSDCVEPLPFRGMNGDPYPAAGRSLAPPHARDLVEYHTRRGIATVGDLRRESE